MSFWTELTDGLGLTNHRGEEQMDRAKEGAQTQAAYATEANRLYQEMMQKGLDSNKASAIASLVSQFGLAGAADKVNRQMLNAQQTQSLPYQTARLAALQALPIMQKMAGMQAYRIPQSVPTTDYTSGSPDFASILKAAVQSLNTTTPTAGAAVANGAAPASSDPYSEIINALSGVLGGTPSTGGNLTSTSTALEAYDPTYDFKESPLYQFKKAESEKNMGRALRAQGFAGSETGAQIAAQEQDRLSAQEAENQWNRIQSIVNIGLGGQASGGGGGDTSSLSSGLNALSSNVGQTLNQAANQRSGLYQDLATGTAENTGQIGQALGQAQSMGYTPSTSGGFLNTLLKAYGIYSGLGGEWKPFAGGGGSYKGYTNDEWLNMPGAY